MAQSSVMTHPRPGLCSLHKDEGRKFRRIQDIGDLDLVSQAGIITETVLHDLK